MAALTGDGGGSSCGGGGGYHYHFPFQRVWLLDHFVPWMARVALDAFPNDESVVPWSDRYDAYTFRQYDARVRGRAWEYRDQLATRLGPS